MTVEHPTASFGEPAIHVQHRSDPRLRILIIEPYCTGSHASWLAGYAAHSRHRISALTMAGRFWKWRMHGGALTMARRVAALGWRPDVVLATDMLDLATFAGLARRELAGLPLAIYFHENQLAYPPLPVAASWPPSRRRRALRQDLHYPFVNLSSALAADKVLWNSAFNRDSFLSGISSFLGAFPDHREAGLGARVAARSEVLPVGLDIAALHQARPAERWPGPPRVLWNHRWEHDKDPDTFLIALESLINQGVAFEVVVLGERNDQDAEAAASLRARLGNHLRHWGYMSDRSAYATWLWQSDVIVSTARQEFFGVAVAEAMACGCQPVLPRRLAYPELIPPVLHEAVLYDDFEDLVARLRTAVLSPDQALTQALEVRMAEFDWSLLAPRYDDVLAGLVSTAMSTRVDWSDR